MKELVISAGTNLHEIYVIGGQEACCSDSPDNAGIPRRIVVERDARADVVIAVMAGASCDWKIDVELVGEGAEANLYGAYVCGGGEKVKMAVDMHHKVPHCNSRQLFKGVAGGESRVDFYGKIIAKIETKPNGDKTIRDFYGRILGKYDAATNTTRDFYGSVVAKGECLSMLIEK